MSENENGLNNIENVTAGDLAKVEFPPVNKNAVEAQAASEAPTPQAASGDDLKGWDASIHVSPPRKNKRGEWEKKRGNKKGFVFGKKKTENENEKPPLEIPKTENEIEAENAEAQKREEMAVEQTKAAAAMISNGVFLVANSFSGYVPENAFQSAYVDAWERYLNSFGGVSLPPWCEVAMMSGTIFINAAKTEKAKPKIQRFKEWLAGKIYAIRNRKNIKKTSSGAPAEA